MLSGLSQGPIPVDEALPIAQQIAEALEAAHEKGITHRDLKRANIKIMPGGKVIVLDFGLEKVREGAASSPTLSNSSMKISGRIGGMILGTAAYMSPEQARGLEADQRSDIFSFGCVLYEMLTGSQAFQGESVSDVLASVIKVEPDFNRLPKSINPGLHELIRRYLVKSPRDRWYAIGDVRVELESLIADPVELVSPPVAVRHPFRRFRFITTLTVALITALVSTSQKTTSGPYRTSKRIGLVCGSDAGTDSPYSDRSAITGSTHLAVVAFADTRDIPGHGSKCRFEYSIFIPMG